MSELEKKVGVHVHNLFYGWTLKLSLLLQPGFYTPGSAEIWPCSGDSYLKGFEFV